MLVWRNSMYEGESLTKSRSLSTRWWWWWYVFAMFIYCLFCMHGLIKIFYTFSLSHNCNLQITVPITITPNTSSVRVTKYHDYTKHLLSGVTKYYNHTKHLLNGVTKWSMHCFRSISSQFYRNMIVVKSNISKYCNMVKVCNVVSSLVCVSLAREIRLNTLFSQVKINVQF